MLKQLESSELDRENYDVVLAALDIKDAFLQVPQQHVVSVNLHGTEYVVLRNLPGQRLGAKAWYWYFREYVTSSMNFEWCSVQPCLATCEGNVFMVHVDDLLFAGSRKFWNQKFLPTMQRKFSVSYKLLGGTGTEIDFLTRRLVMLSDGMMIVPGTSAAKVVECFEKHFGYARLQKVPSDSALQQEDNAQKLSAADAKNYRSVIGLLLYLSRDRADIMFVVELASAMSSPSLCSVQRLRKLIGFTKHTGVGKIKQGTEAFCFLKIIRMQTGVQTKHTGGALAAQFTSWMDASALVQVVHRRWFHFHQLRTNCTVWLVVVAMEFSFEAVCSFLCLEKSNTTSSLTIQRKDSWFQGKELDESDICQGSFFGCNQRSWMAVLLFIKYQPYGTSAMLERRAYHVQGYSFYFVGLVWLMLQQPNLWEWMSTTMWQNKKPDHTTSYSARPWACGCGKCWVEWTMPQRELWRGRAPGALWNVVGDFHFAGSMVSFCIHGMVCMEKNAREPPHVRTEAGQSSVGHPLLLDSGFRRGQLHCPTSCKDRWTSQSIYDDWWTSYRSKQWGVDESRLYGWTSLFSCGTGWILAFSIWSRAQRFDFDGKPGKSRLGGFQCDGSRTIPQSGETTCVCGRWRNNRCADEWKPKYRRSSREWECNRWRSDSSKTSTRSKHDRLDGGIENRVQVGSTKKRTKRCSENPTHDDADVEWYQKWSNEWDGGKLQQKDCGSVLSNVRDSQESEQITKQSLLRTQMCTL